MWGGLPCIYMRILWKEVFNPIHFKTLFVYPYRDISSIIKVGCRTIRPCSGLTSLTLPAGITSIGEYAFRGCSGLTSIYVYSEKVPKWVLTCLKVVMLINVPLWYAPLM
mgnify:CR=1 FL=1